MTSCRWSVHHARPCVNSKMVKAYLRYEHCGSFGVISAAGSLAYDPASGLLAAAALEDITVWNVKQASRVSAAA